jgi:hypothetical protein
MVVSAAVLVALIGCSHSETHPETHHQRPGDAATLMACRGRGDVLDELRVEAELVAGRVAELSFIEGTPTRPIVGNNSWLFLLTVDGEPASNVASSIAVTPFMPDHGHGTPTAVGVTEGEPGQYSFEPVHTRMAGFWEIAVEVDTASLKTRFTFGVCVE